MKNKIDKNIIITFVIMLALGLFGVYLGTTQQWKEVSNNSTKVIIISIIYLIISLIDEKMTKWLE